MKAWLENKKEGPFTQAPFSLISYLLFGRWDYGIVEGACLAYNYFRWWFIDFWKEKLYGI